MSIVKAWSFQAIRFIRTVSPSASARPLMPPLLPLCAPVSERNHRVSQKNNHKNNPSTGGPVGVVTELLLTLVISWSDKYVAERYKVTLSLARVLWRARVRCWSASSRVWWSAPAADGGNCAHQTLLLLLLLRLLAPAAAAAGPGRRRRAGPHPLGTSTGAGGREDGACSYIASGSTIHRIRSQLVMCIPSSAGGRIRVWTWACSYMVGV